MRVCACGPGFASRNLLQTRFKLNKTFVCLYKTYSIVYMWAYNRTNNNLEPFVKVTCDGFRTSTCAFRTFLCTNLSGLGGSVFVQPFTFAVFFSGLKFVTSSSNDSCHFCVFFW